MYSSVDDLRAFYNSDIGAIVQHTLQKRICSLWGDVHDYRILGCGYALPYLSALEKRSERVIAMMSANQGVQRWPQHSENRTLLCDESYLPIENASVDCVLLVHHLEYCNDLPRALHEIWRILKSNGRVLIIVPNRMGLWARADWSPLGHGHPFTQSQLEAYLRKAKLCVDSHEGALFMPPIPKSPVVMKSAHLFERMGRSFMPFIAGVHVVEAHKEIYARVDKTGTGSAVLEKTKDMLVGKGKPIPQSRS